MSKRLETMLARRIEKLTQELNGIRCRLDKIADRSNNTTDLSDACSMIEYFYQAQDFAEQIQDALYAIDDERRKQQRAPAIAPRPTSRRKP